MAAPGFRKQFSANLKAELPAQLPAYLKNQRWFGGKAREINAAEVVDLIGLQRAGVNAIVLLVKVEYNGGGDDFYSVPLLAAEGGGSSEDGAGKATRVH